MISSGFLCRDTADKPIHIPVESGFIFRIGGNCDLFHAGKHVILEIIFQRFLVFGINQIVSKQSNSPGSAFAGGFHYRDRSMNGGSEIILSNTFCFEQSAVSIDTVYGNMFTIHDFHAVFESFHTGINLCTHKVGKIHCRIRKADKQRAAYYNYYATGTWGNVNNYHLCVDTGALGSEGAVDLICKCVEIRG